MQHHIHCKIKYNEQNEWYVTVLFRTVNKQECYLTFLWSSLCPYPNPSSDEL